MYRRKKFKCLAATEEIVTGVMSQLCISMATSVNTSRHHNATRKWITTKNEVQAINIIQNWIWLIKKKLGNSAIIKQMSHKSPTIESNLRRSFSTQIPQPLHLYQNFPSFAKTSQAKQFSVAVSRSSSNRFFTLFCRHSFVILSYGQRFAFL